MKLQKSPFGLLGLLDLKQLGQNPDQFGAEIYGMVDVTDLYAAPNLQLVTATGNLQLSSDVLELSVPANTVWRLRSLACRVSINAGDLAGIMLGFRNDPSGAVVGLFAQYSQFSASQSFACARYFDRPFTVPPGGRLTALNLAAFGAARAASLNAIVEAFPA